MGSGTEAEWAAFVASAWPGLVRTATLLVGSADRAEAEELAAAALVRARRRARRRAPDRDAGSDSRAMWSELARRSLLTLPGTPGVRLRSWIRGPAPAGDGHSDRVLGLYLTLPARQRALLVLTVEDGLDLAAAAGVLGLSQDTAADDLAAGLDALHGPGADDDLEAQDVVELDLGDVDAAGGAHPRVDVLLIRDPVVPQLRSAFARLTAAAPVPREGEGPRRVDLASAADRLSRRRRAAAAVGLSLTVAAATGIVVRENARIEAARQRTAAESAAYAAAHPSVLTGDVSRWPTRGSRARDGGLLADVEARVGARPTVLFAGDVVGTDVVVALTGPGYAPLLHVLAGSPATPVDSWRETGAGLLVGPEAVPAVTAAVPDEKGRLHLLAVTLTSGVAVAYSPAPVLADDATVTRRYLRLPLTDGIGTALVTAPADRLRVRVRVDGAGVETVVAPLTLARPVTAAPPLPAPAGPVTPVTPLTPARSCAKWPGLGGVPQLVGEATRDAGLAPSELTKVRLLWCRQDGHGGEAAVALAAVRGPDIQCYESIDRTVGSMRTASSRCWPVPRGTGATAAFLAPQVTFGSPRPDVLGLTVHAPGASTAEVLPGPPGSVPLARTRVGADGYVRLALPLTPSTAGSALDRESLVVLRDPRGEALDVLPVRSRHLSDVWGERG